MNKLLIDIGQTGAQWRLDTPNSTGRVVAHPGLDGSVEILGQVAGIVCTALVAVEGATEVYAGVSGLDDITDAASTLCAALATWGVSRVVVAHDSVTSALGALGGANGVVLAIGTGIVTMGVGPAGAKRVDGWGSLLDDAGSAYWIGGAGLRSALRDADGRGDHTPLLERAIAEFGPISQISGAIQQSPTRVVDIARFAKIVTELAGEGDAVSLAICDRAIAEWFNSVLAAAARSGLAPTMTNPVRLTWSGSVLTNSAVLQARFRAFIPDNFDLRPPLGLPLDGAAQLVDLAPDTLFSSMIDASSLNRKPSL